MGFFDKIRKKKKYFRYELQVNDGGGWKKYGDFVEYLDYEDIENPDPGSILKLYGVFNDLSKKDGISKKSLWEHEVPTPGGKKEKDGKDKEKPVEERLMEKIVEGADFSGLKPTKLSIPLGKTGGSLDFESPVLIPAGGDGEGGYLVIDGNKYPTGNIPPLEFEGKLPAWLHPAAGAMIMGLIDKAGGMINDAVSKGISKATGIKQKEEPASEGFTKKEGEVKEPSEKPPDLVSDLDNLLAEGEEETEVETKEKKKKEKSPDLLLSEDEEENEVETKEKKKKGKVK